MRVHFTCKEQELRTIEQFLFQQEYKSKPPFTHIILETPQSIHVYEILYAFKYWRIVTSEDMIW